MRVGRSVSAVVASHAALTAAVHGVTTAVADTDDIETHALLPTVHQNAPHLIDTHARLPTVHQNAPQLITAHALFPTVHQNAPQLITAHAGLPTVHQNAPTLISDHAGLPTVHQDAPALIAAANIPLIVRKTAEQIINNSTTLVNDTHLLAPLAINEVWEFELYLYTDAANATPNLKAAIALPENAVVEQIVWYRDVVPAEKQLSSQDGSALTHLCDIAPSCNFVAKGIVIVGDTAGNFQVQWAQATAHASDTKVLANSYICAHKIS